MVEGSLEVAAVEVAPPSDAVKCEKVRAALRGLWKTVNGEQLHCLHEPRLNSEFLELDKNTKQPENKN